MKGDAKPFLKFVDGSGKRFIIPIYQRNYSWQIKHCEKLLQDLKALMATPNIPHFFGSIVSSSMNNGHREDYLIIDGQQRLTTVSILLVAMVNLLKSGLINVQDNDLCDKITECHLVDKYNKDRKVRLKPVNEDRLAFDALFGDETDFILTSNITANYLYFKEQLLDNIDLEQLYDAISRLEIIDIFLEKEDNPQLIFESLNSTGLALEEGDKIRNYILMSLNPTEQELFYEKYWRKIEKKTEYENCYYVSDFIKNYLTIKLGKTIVFRDIYDTFKEFSHSLNRENLLIDLLRYASFYEILLTPKKFAGKLEENLSRLNQLGFTVIHPFLMAVLERQSSGELSVEQTQAILSVVETYIFRRLIVGLASNALAKLFAGLDKEIIKRQIKGYDYVEICKFILSNKEQSVHFPTDEEFLEILMTRNIYSLSSSNKQYLFSRLENGNSKEQDNVIDRLQNGEYTIEHIMPQTLTNAWKQELGEQYNELHKKWLHTLPNLTLTAYNSQYCNLPFINKLTIEDGFQASNLRLNKFISRCEKWTEDELKERRKILESDALKYWPFPSTAYSPPKRESSAYTLEDDFNCTGATLYFYEFLGEEKTASNWKDMLRDVVASLIKAYPAQIQQLALENNYISTKKLSNSYAQLGNYYIYANCNNQAKINGLRYFFKHCGIDYSALTFNILTNIE